MLSALKNQTSDVQNSPGRSMLLDVGLPVCIHMLWKNLQVDFLTNTVDSWRFTVILVNPGIKDQQPPGYHLLAVCVTQTVPSCNTDQSWGFYALLTLGAWTQPCSPEWYCAAHCTSLPVTQFLSTISLQQSRTTAKTIILHFSPNYGTCNHRILQSCVGNKITALKNRWS